MQKTQIKKRLQSAYTTQMNFQHFPLGLQPAWLQADSKSTYMKFPDHLRYTKDHEWISLEGNVATIGITDYAQRELGDIVFVEVESIGKELEAGSVFGTVEAVKTVSDLFLPVAGRVTELNPDLKNQPESVNSDPYGKGWMVKMTVNNPADVEALMDAAGYEALVS
jgi:glycine cleavage system H protein